MFRKKQTQKLVEYLLTLSKDTRNYIAKEISASIAKEELRKKELAKKRVLNDIKLGLLEIEESKRTGKPLKKLSEFLEELKQEESSKREKKKAAKTKKAQTL
jgi:hypothetical protein